MAKEIKEKEKYTQVCVLADLALTEADFEDFEQKFQEALSARIQTLEVIETTPDLDSNGNIIRDTGGRHDVFFAIHQDDISSFAVKRFRAPTPIRWVEDVLSNCNYRQSIYPERVFDYISWNANGDEE